MNEKYYISNKKLLIDHSVTNLNIFFLSFCVMQICKLVYFLIRKNGLLVYAIDRNKYIQDI